LALLGGVAAALGLWRGLIMGGLLALFGGGRA